ncbi:hypothetical protein ACFLZ7_03820 [Nanoarchaeota archaeon]
MDFKTHKRKLSELPPPTLYQRHKKDIKFALYLSLGIGILSGLNNGADYIAKKINENNDRERAALDRSYRS